MPARTPDEIVADARARFDAGERRSAWDSLLTRARRSPGELVYREALVDFYRRAGSPDQAGRWAAHDLTLATDHERRALARSLRSLRTTGQVRDYLVLPGGLPPDVEALRPTARQRRRARAERYADELTVAAGIVGAFLGAPAVVTGLVVTVVLAFHGDRDTQSAAQYTIVAGLFAVAFLSTLLLAATALRGRRILVALLALVDALAVFAVAHADLTAAHPFG